MRRRVGQARSEGDAVLVGGEQALLPHLGQAGGGGVLGGELELQVASVTVLGGPVDGQVRVERVHAVLAAGCVRGRAQVGDRGRVVQGEEGVPEPLGQVDRPPVDVVDQHRVPLPERRRPLPQVDHHVQRGTRETGHPLGLARRELGEVDAPQRAGGGDRAVGLGEPQRMAGRLGEVVLTEPLQEHAPVVAVLDRRHFQGTGY